ncbi:hypothetical protein PF006_g18815 [Phytophthora fragariae]|uniref:Uncharacterized protein n=1 Tax=Phytophthora fragariae TaxID=53985 RepID=A0A6A3SHU1_9STRA|nr:hypothetical protein PF006_g18815 [Phytophthora fragariae]
MMLEPLDSSSDASQDEDIDFIINPMQEDPQEIPDETPKPTEKKTEPPPQETTKPPTPKPTPKPTPEPSSKPPSTQAPTKTPAPKETPKPQPEPNLEKLWAPVKTLSELDEFECVAWRQTANCSPRGDLKSQRDAGCDRVILPSDSGFCEYRHRKTGELRRIIAAKCKSRASQMEYSCANATMLVRYNLMADDYKPAYPLSFENNQRDLLQENDFAKDNSSKTVVFLPDGNNTQKLWQYVQQYNMNQDLRYYEVRGDVDHRWFPSIRKCYGRRINYLRAYSLKPISDFPFAGLEDEIIGHVHEGVEIIKKSGYVSTPEPPVTKAPNRVRKRRQRRKKVKKDKNDKKN